MEKNNEKEITITIEGKEWKDAIDKAFEEANKKVKIDGFRPGKAPKDVFYKKYGKESFLVVVLDTGGTVQNAWKNGNVVMDLAYSRNADSGSDGLTGNNITFNIKRWGW